MTPNEIKYFVNACSIVGLILLSVVWGMIYISYRVQKMKAERAKVIQKFEDDFNNLPEEPDDDDDDEPDDDEVKS